MPRYDVPIVARPARAGSGVPGDHVLFHVALEAAFDAWITALEEHCGGLIVQRELALVHVEGDFHRELANGSATADVAVRKVGRASITLVVELSQDGADGLTVTFVFAQVDAARAGSRPWTAAQRSALEALTR